MESNNSTNLPPYEVTLLFLGTGAADWPAEYPPPERHFKRGEVRGMSSMLVNGHILIDCGPTVLDAMNRFAIDPAAITDIVLTHTHDDHFHPDSILTMASVRNPELGPLRFWAHPAALQRVPESSRIEQCPVEIGKTIEMHGLGVTGLEANHAVQASAERCLYYLFECAKATVLYATDGSWLLKSTWQYLQNRHLDVLIWDATIGERAGDFRVFEHNDLTMIRHMKQTLSTNGILKPDSRVILTHLARTLHGPHEQLEDNLLPKGLIPAYDGMVVALE